MSGIPVDIAFDNQRCFAAFPNIQTQFSAGAPLEANGKGTVKVRSDLNTIPINVSESQYMFVAVPNNIGGSGVVDVVDISRAGTPRVRHERFPAWRAVDCCVQRQRRRGLLAAVVHRRSDSSAPASRFLGAGALRFALAGTAPLETRASGFRTLLAMPEPTEVRSMFARIAGRYDFLNHVLSMGVDRSWRRRVVERAGAVEGQPVIDLCCGTGDLAVRFARAGARVFALDFTARDARARAAQAQRAPR